MDPCLESLESHQYYPAIEKALTVLRSRLDVVPRRNLETKSNPEKDRPLISQCYSKVSSKVLEIFHDEASLSQISAHISGCLENFHTKKCANVWTSKAQEERIKLKYFIRLRSYRRLCKRLRLRLHDIVSGFENRGSSFSPQLRSIKRSRGNVVMSIFFYSMNLKSRFLKYWCEFLLSTLSSRN